MRPVLFFYVKATKLLAVREVDDDDDDAAAAAADNNNNRHKNGHGYKIFCFLLWVSYDLDVETWVSISVLPFASIT